MSSLTYCGRHVAAIVGALCVAIVLAPVAVVAASSGVRTTTTARVYITDPHNPAHMAAVSSTGAISVNVVGLPGIPKSFTDGSGSGSTSISLPPGYRFVIQTVGIRCAVSSGGVVSAHIEYQTSGLTQQMWIPISYAFTSGGDDYYVASAPLVIYADASANVTLYCNASAGTADQSILTASGYLTR